MWEAGDIGYLEGPQEGQLGMRLETRMETGDQPRAKASGTLQAAGSHREALRGEIITIIRWALGRSPWQEADGLWDQVGR